jgi:hypothetical protein
MENTSEYIKEIEKWLREEAREDNDFPGWFRNSFQKHFPEFKERLIKKKKYPFRSKTNKADKIIYTFTKQ